MGALHLGGETIEYTDNPFELYMQQKLEKQGIDVSMDDYIMNPKFKELFFSFVTEKWNSVTEAWWVEEHFVGRERLEQIYGPYAMCRMSNTELPTVSLTARPVVLVIMSAIARNVAI